jgi:hypothetical protein
MFSKQKSDIYLSTRRKRGKGDLLPHHALKGEPTIAGIPFNNPPKAMIINPTCLCLELVLVTAYSLMR